MSLLCSAGRLEARTRSRLNARKLVSQETSNIRPWAENLRRVQADQSTGSLKGTDIRPSSPCEFWTSSSSIGRLLRLHFLPTVGVQLVAHRSQQPVAQMEDLHRQGHTQRLTGLPTTLRGSICTCRLIIRKTVSISYQQLHNSTTRNVDYIHQHNSMAASFT